MTPYLEGFARARAADIARSTDRRWIVEHIPGRGGGGFTRKNAGRRFVLLE